MPLCVRLNAPKTSPSSVKREKEVDRRNLLLSVMML